MTTLVTQAEAFAQLRFEEGFGLPDAADVMVKAEEASEIVLDYVTDAEKSDWTDADCPPLVKAAIKLVLTNLYDDRSGDPLTPGVKNVLRRHRDPTLA